MADPSGRFTAATLARWLPSGPAPPSGHLKRPPNHSRRRRCQRILRQLFLARPSYIRHVASCPCFSPHHLAQIIQNHKMIFRTPVRIPRNPLEHLDQIQYFHFDRSLLREFAPHTVRDRFADLQHPSGNRPLAFERRASPSDQQRALVPDDYAADTHHRPLRILASPRHLCASPRFREKLDTGVI